MKTKLAIVFALFCFRAPVFAHRIDEYLQAMLVSVGEKQIQVSMRLIPGTAVSGTIISAVDSNGDGVFSETEGQAYAQRVLRDLSLTLDGGRAKPRLEAVTLPAAAEIREGLGQIQIKFVADIPGAGSHRTLIVENHHQAPISVYLMNCLVPHDRNISVTAQNRSENQAYYRVDWVQSDGQQDSLLSRWRSGLATAVAPLASLPTMLR